MEAMCKPKWGKGFGGGVGAACSGVQLCEGDVRAGLGGVERRQGGVERRKGGVAAALRRCVQVILH